MKRKFTITFEVNAHYPHIEKETKKLAKAFDQWLHDWADSDSAPRDIMPVLYTGNPGNEHQANGTVRVKITRDKEIILDTWWDELSDDF
jgi:hypothetical protein